jgi:hypothetical protein
MRLPEGARIYFFNLGWRVLYAFNAHRGKPKKVAISIQTSQAKIISSEN